jgi:Fe-S-cluster-containing dehydrogenase component
MNVCSTTNKKNHSLSKSAIKVRTTGGIASNYVAIVCLGCREPACIGICPSDSLKKRPGGGVTVNEESCIGCRKCVPICIMRAINFDEETKKPIICRHCGVCTRFCPHNCLQMVDSEEAIIHA